MSENPQRRIGQICVAERDEWPVVSIVALTVRLIRSQRFNEIVDDRGAHLGRRTPTVANETL